jgi:hypothetical protein
MNFCLQLRPWAHMDFHVVNTSPLINVLMRIIFPFLSSKLKQHVSTTCNYYISLSWHVML